MLCAALLHLYEKLNIPAIAGNLCGVDLYHNCCQK